MDKDHEQKKPPPNADVDRYNVLDDLSEEIWKEAMRLFVKEKKKKWHVHDGSSTGFHPN